MVTGQLADMPTYGLDISRTGQLTDWTTRRYRLRGHKTYRIISL